MNYYKFICDLLDDNNYDENKYINESLNLNYKIEKLEIGKIEKELKKVDDEDIKAGRINDRLNNIKEMCDLIIQNLNNIGVQQSFELIKNKVEDIINEDNGNKKSSNDIEGNRLLFESSFNENVKESTETIEHVHKKIDDVILRLNKLEQNSNSLVVSLISILGIFVAIAFAGFGGITLIGNTLEVTSFSGISKDNIFGVLFICAILGFVLFNILFLTMYFIARITDRSIAMNCVYAKENEHCFNCNVIGNRDNKKRLFLQ